jgi:hypothetical protein
MKRQPEPHWKATHKAWYLNLGGEKIRLGTDKEKA